MFCFKCGSQQADDTKFCGACGTRLAGVLEPQSGPPVAVAPSVGPPPANSSPARETRAADSHLTVEEWAVTCSPPDSDGDVRFEAKVRGEYRGTASAHVARLSWIAFDPSGSIPLLQGDNTLNEDIDDEDSVEIEADGYGKLGEGVDPAACQVQGQVVLYPGEKQATWTIPLPEAGQTGGKGPTWSSAGAEITGWRVTCSESSDENASYTLFLVAQNTNRFPLAAVTFRVRVKNRKGDVWSTEHLIAERLGPGEICSVETALYVSERAKARKGALIEVVGLVSSRRVVYSVPATPPVLLEPEEGAEGLVDDGSEDSADASRQDVLESSDIQEVMGLIKTELDLVDQSKVVCVSVRVIEEEHEYGHFLIDDKDAPRLPDPLRRSLSDRRLPGVRINGNKTSLALMWILPAEEAELNRALGIEQMRWSIALEDGFDGGNIKCENLGYADSSRGISTETKALTAEGTLTERPAWLAEQVFEYGTEGSVVFGYEMNDTPWDVRILARDGGIYRAKVWRKESDGPFQSWIKRELLK